MDFLANLKQKLQEMEEQARLLQALEQAGDQPVLGRDGKPLFQPRGQASAPQRKGAVGPGSRQEAAQPRGADLAQQARVAQQARQAQNDARLAQQQLPQVRRQASNEEFETPQCVSAGGIPVQQGQVGVPEGALRPRLIDDLRGRLDEAFLLSEILGPPRCVRGWSDE